MMPGGMANDWFNRSADPSDKGTQPLAAEPRTSAASGGTVVGPASAAQSTASMPPTWIWMQVAIVVVVLIGMIVAVTKLA